MTHNQQTTTLPIRVLAAALALTAALGVGLAIALGSLELPSFGPAAPAQPIASPVSDALIEAGREWERQRHQQSGYVDPLIEAGREWERQRDQQSGYVDPLDEAGREWERQRKQQAPR
jgi:hypothetical protein